MVPVAAGGPAPVQAAPGEQRATEENPDLDAACGIDIHVVLDESSSIRQSAATGDVRTAFRAFVGALRNTGSRLAVSEFGTQARLPLSGAAARAYTTVTDETIARTFEPYISTGYDPPPIGANTQYTNWEDALRVGRHILPRPRADVPHLVLFITDGDPTAVIRQNQVTPEEYETKVPLSSTEVQTGINSDVALAPAIPNSNAIKAQGSHVLAVGVGEALDNAASLSRLVQIAGPQVFPDNTDFDISTTDVYRESDFSLLEGALREAAFQLCAPSVNIQKLVDHDPDPAVDALVPGDGWTMSAEVSPEPATWVLPGDGVGASATNQTGGDGFVNFQWTTAAPTSSTITVSEEAQPGLVNDPSATTCSYITPESPTPAALPGLVATDGGFTGTVPADAIVTCQLVNRLVPTPAIDLVKTTNGVHADEPPGPSIPVGAPVVWTYRVTNVGNVPLSDLALVDDRLGPISCPQDQLEVQEVVTCTATGVAEPGQYVNTATASAVGAGTPVTDTDISHHSGSRPGIDIEKLVNGEDADDPPGLFLPVGADVGWTYIVTNTGDTAVTDVAVTDVVTADGSDVPVDCPLTSLAVGASMTCTAAPEVVVSGPHENVATVTATSETDPTEPLQDSDPSHHFGEEPSIALVKTVNGEDADLPPGVAVPVGEGVIWRFRVTNTGNVPLQWSLSDPDVTPLACPRILVLAPGASTTCFARGTAEAGLHANTATAVGTSPSGATVEDEDPAHHFGALGAISIEKLVNGEDADEPPGPVVPLGGAVEWTYVVTNTGNAPLTGVTVVDTKEVAVACPTDELGVGADMVCTASGNATEGAYTNFGIVIAETSFGAIVRDEDPANHFGGSPGIHVEKLTNGMADLDEAPGPGIDVGDVVDWTYIVTNTGNLDLDDVTVVDDQLGAIECPATTLAVGAEMTCTATGTAQEGQYVNQVDATGIDSTGETVEDEDVSHHFGVVRAIEVVKRVNGDDADEAPGLQIPVGEPVLMTFEVTNPGNVALVDVELVDDRGLTPVATGGDGDGAGELDPGEVWTYEADLGPAVPGRYDNVVTVTAHDGTETGVSDSDPAFAGTTVGPVPGITVDKEATPTVVDAGGTAEFTITVTNTGQVDLTGVVVSDPAVPACDRAIGDLPVGASVSVRCTARIDQSIVNVASVTATGVDGTAVSAEDRARVDVRAPSADVDGSGTSGPLPRTGRGVADLLLMGVALLVVGAALRRRSLRARAR